MFVRAKFAGLMGQDLVSFYPSFYLLFPLNNNLLFSFCLFVFVAASASESVTFNGGKKKDKQKNPNCLANQIPSGKKVLADLGLKGSAKASTRKASNSHKMKHFRARAQGRQETLFKRFRDFGILRQ